MIPGLCPFDDILLGVGLCALALWIRNKWRKMRGKPPIKKECKHQAQQQDPYDWEDDPRAWMEETPMRDFHDDCGDRE